MTHRRQIGKLEAKKAREFVHQNLVSRRRLNNPDEIVETVFNGEVEKLEAFVLAEVKQNRTGEIPEYPQGLVCFDDRSQGYFNVVTLEDEVSLF